MSTAHRIVGGRCQWCGESEERIKDRLAPQQCREIPFDYEEPDRPAPQTATGGY